MSEDVCCVNFGGFWRGFSWRIFLGTFSYKNEEKKSGEKIREKIRRPKKKTSAKNPFCQNPTLSDGIAKLFRACFCGGIEQLSRDILQKGVSHRCAYVKLSAKRGYRTTLGECQPSFKKYRAIWGIAAIVSQYCAMWGHSVCGAFSQLFALSDPTMCLHIYVYIYIHIERDAQTRNHLQVRLSLGSCICMDLLTLRSENFRMITELVPKKIYIPS